MSRTEDERESLRRQMENLMGDLAPLLPYFDNKSVTNVYVYGSGRVQVEEFRQGVRDIDVSLQVDHRMRIISSLASVSGTPIDTYIRPELESIIPKYNIRVTAIIPPWTAAPEITFRRPAEKVFTLEEYLQEGRMSQELYDKINSHITNRSNIVISGSTGSGKTTFTNAIIAKMAELSPDERFYIVEDTPELQCKAVNTTQLYIRKEQAVTAIQTALRWTPKRIIFGEIRSGEVAVELLEAWNTGHPGNVTTVHADSAVSTVSRLQGLLRQKIAGALPDMAETIGLIVHLKGKSGFGPVVTEALTLKEINELVNSGSAGR